MKTRKIPLRMCVGCRQMKEKPTLIRAVCSPEGVLSLAIGKEGQNARLAARLTGWKIDIKSQSQMAELNDMVDENGQLVDYVQVETPVYDSFTMNYDDSVLGDDDTV